MIRLTASAAVAAALILAAAGCGGSSAKTSAPATTTTAESADASGTPTDTTAGTDTTGSSTGTSSGTVAKGCLDFAGASSKIGQALAAGASGASTEDLKTYFSALADKAPSSVKASFQTFAEGFGKYADALKAAGFKPGDKPTPAQIQKLQQASKEISTPEFKQASDDINAWVEGGCKS
jgi:hypothetical protein